MGINTKWLSFALIIISALILAYGVIDKNAYRAGYTAGSLKVSRAVDAACSNGWVFDNALCSEAEMALYDNQNADEDIYIAQTAAALNPSAALTPSSASKAPTAPLKRKRRGVSSVKKLKGGEISQVAAPAPVALTFPAGFSPFMWIAQSADTAQQSSLVSTATTTVQLANATTTVREIIVDRQKIIAAQCPKAKILFYAGGLPETADANEIKGLASCPPTGILDASFSDGMSVKDAAGGIYAVTKTGTHVLDVSWGLVLVMPPPPPPPSPEEILKAKALGANCAAAAKNSEACLAMDPYCVMSVIKRDGSGTYVNTDYTAGCTDSETRIKRVFFNPDDPCSDADIQARIPRARMVTGTLGEKICSDNITYMYLKADQSSGKLMPLGDKGSLSELLRSPGLKDFAKKVGATAVPLAPAAPALPLCSTVMGRVPMPPCTPDPMPSGGYHYMPPHTAAPSNSFFANIVDAILNLFRRP